MSRRNNNKIEVSGGGCGCLGCFVFLPFLIAVVLALWTLWFGLPTPWGTFNIDIFPPQIRQTGGPVQ